MVDFTRRQQAQQLSQALRANPNAERLLAQKLVDISRRGQVEVEQDSEETRIYEQNGFDRRLAARILSARITQSSSTARFR